MELTTPTLESGALATAKFFGIPHEYPDHTVINDWLQIQPGVRPDASVYPTAKYTMIGYGGHRPFTTTNGRLVALPIQHRVTDTGLFSPIPFVLRDPNNDLTPSERANYCLRGTLTPNNASTPKIAYWGKRTDLSSAVVERQEETIQNGTVVNTAAYAYTSANEKPTPTQPLQGEPDLTNGDFVSPVTRIWVGLESEWEANELLNVSKQLFGDEYGVIISEIAIVAGVDKPIQVGGGSGSGGFTFNEVIGAQVMNYLAVNFNVGLGVNLKAGTYVNVGVSSPMYVLS